MSKIVKIYDTAPSEKLLQEVADSLERGAVVIYPTDSLYALGCSLNNIKAINRIKAIKHKTNDELSIICDSLSMVADYAKVDNQTFKIIKRNTPAPFTFILTPSNNIPNQFLDSKNSVGVRVPDNIITRGIIEKLGSPLVSTTIPLEDFDESDRGSASLIWEKYMKIVDLMIDGGDLMNVPTTVVDLRDGNIDILRESKAILTI